MTWIPALTAIISIIATLSGVLLGWSGRSREVKKEIKSEAVSGAALRQDVEYIKRGVDDIRVEQRAMREDMSCLAERVTRVEESAKQAHKRIDGMEGKRGE